MGRAPDAWGMEAMMGETCTNFSVKGSSRGFLRLIAVVRAERSMSHSSHMVKMDP